MKRFLWGVIFLGCAVLLGCARQPQRLPVVPQARLVMEQLQITELTGELSVAERLHLASLLEAFGEPDRAARLDVNLYESAARRAEAERLWFQRMGSAQPAGAALSKDPRSIRSAWFAAQKTPKKALETAVVWTQRWPLWLEGWTALGISYAAVGDWPRAERAWRHDPQAPRAKVGLAALVGKKVEHKASPAQPVISKVRWRLRDIDGAVRGRLRVNFGVKPAPTTIERQLAVRIPGLRVLTVHSAAPAPGWWADVIMPPAALVLDPRTVHALGGPPSRLDLATRATRETFLDLPPHTVEMRVRWNDDAEILYRETPGTLTRISPDDYPEFAQKIRARWRAFQQGDERGKALR